MGLMHVAVLGGGISGLTAAHALVASGCDVSLVEAGDRLGGQVRTRRSHGFLVEDGRTGAWARHVEFMADTFGDLVHGWKPINETNYYAELAYKGGGWPPGRDDRPRPGQEPPPAEAVWFA